MCWCWCMCVCVCERAVRADRCCIYVLHTCEREANPIHAHEYILLTFAFGVGRSKARDVGYLEVDTCGTDSTAHYHTVSSLIKSDRVQRKEKIHSPRCCICENCKLCKYLVVSASLASILFPAQNFHRTELAHTHTRNAFILVKFIRKNKQKILYFRFGMCQCVSANLCTFDAITN